MQGVDYSPINILTQNLMVNGTKGSLAQFGWDNPIILLWDKIECASNIKSLNGYQELNINALGAQLRIIWH